MHSTEQSPIREYVRLLRAYATHIAAIAILCGLAAFLFSVRQDERYDATATLQFKDPSLASGLAGAPVPVASTGEQLAARGAQTVLTSEVLDSVRDKTGTGDSVSDLRSKLEVEVNAKSTLVSIKASDSSAGGAAGLANTVAREAVDTQTQSVRESYRRAAERTARELRSLRDDRDSASQLAVAQRLAPLRALAASADPVSVAEPADVPDSPAAPKPIRDTLIGLFIGLLLGAVVAFARDSLDRRLRNATDVQGHFGLPVVARVRAEAMGLTPYIAGEREPMAEQDVESFRILRANLGFLSVDSPMCLIAITSPMPEEGKSTVAGALALTSAAMGKTLLVECDLRRPSLGGRLSAETQPGLADLLAGKASFDEVAQVVEPTHVGVTEGASSNGAGADDGAPAMRLTFIAAGSEAPLPAELLASARFRDFLEDVKGRFDTVIVDTAPLLSVADTIEILPLMDAVLVCIRVDRTTREQATAARSALDRVPQRPSAVVVTGLRARDEDSYGYYSYEYKGERSLSGSA